MLLLFPFLVLVMVGLVLSLAAAVFSFFTKSILFRAVSVFCVLACLVLALVAGRRLMIGEPEWNPAIKNDREVVGVWGGPSHTLRLMADHRFTYQDGATTSSGGWIRDDWNLYLKKDATDPNATSTLFRFIEYRGQLRVLTHEMDDPDGWDGDVGLPKERAL